MNTFKKYLSLIEEYPSLFESTGESGEIRIIHDPELIKKEQKRIRGELKKEGNPECWIDIGVLSEDQWFWVVRDMVEFPDGHIAGYIRFINRKTNIGGGFSVVLLCVQKDQVLLIRKYHHGERRFIWEFPRGFGEPDLSGEDNARKELKEEVGLTASKLTLLTNVVEGKGGTSVFYVEIEGNQTIKLEKGEAIENYRWVSMAALDELVAQGKLEDWFSMWAYALLKAS